MRSLTPRQNAALKVAQHRRLEWIFSTKSANRKQAEEGVRHTYRAGGVPEPAMVLWFDDLIEALLVLEQLSDYRHSNWKLPPESLRRRERVRRQLRNMLGLRTWSQVIHTIGAQHTANRYDERRHKGFA